jgi:HK97 gp10 family phage protein
MADIKIHLEGVEELLRKVSDPQVVGLPLRNMIQKSAALVSRKAKEKAPVDTGRLRQSIHWRTTRDIEAIIEPSVDYAAFVEFGTKPHWPPSGALDGWARRHGISPAFLVARAIARRGTKPQPYMEPAARESQSDINGFVTDAAREIERMWGG